MQHPAFEEVTVHHGHTDDATFRKKVVKTTIILSVITVIELGLGLLLWKLALPDGFLRLFIKGVIVILSLGKAFYIVSIFMHLGDEIRNMIMTIVVPLMLFIWFIIAFVADGNSYKNLRNKYDPHFKESTMPKEHHKTEKPEAKPVEKSGKD
jgi:cytochrome c oxidase subunit 4